MTDTTFSSMASMAARTAYITDMKAQLHELLTRYDPAILWFDGDWCTNHDSPTLDDWWVGADGAGLYDWLIGQKQSLIVNERVKRDLGLGDYTSPEQFVPAAPLSRPWETNTTMNGAWGYNASLENDYKTPASLIQEMVRVVSRDGNYLLNIGPKGDGTVTAGSVQILNAFGVWMATYSASIYDTTPSPFSVEPAWGFYTKKAGTLYAHVLTWPTGGTLQIAALQNTILRISLMNDPATSLTYAVSGGMVNINIPDTAPDAADSVVVIEVSGTPAPATGG
jgi:alpha-L-fucosidase